MRRFLSTALALTLACDDEATSTGNPPPTELPSETFVVYGPPASTDLTPYPSNRYAVDDADTATGLRVDVTTETTADELAVLHPSITEQLNELDGFSTVGGVTIHFDGSIDPASFTLPIEGFTTGDAPLRLIDVDPTSDEFGVSRGLTIRYYPNEGTNGEHVLVAQPATPLKQRTRYLFVVTTAVKDEDGRPIGSSPDMKAVLAGETAGTYEDSVREALSAIAEPQALSADDVVLATVFTTQTVHDKTVAVMEALEAAPAPTLDGELTTGRIGQGSDHRREYIGRITAPEWRDDAGRFTFDADGAPVMASTTGLEFSLVINRSDTAGPKPVVVFAHGLTASKSMTWDVAKWLSGLDVIVIGIDAPEHGSRKTPGLEGLDVVFQFLGVDDDEGTFDLARGADTFRQMTSDQRELVRAIQGPLSELDLLPSDAPDGVPEIDPTRVVYLGQSFGALLSSPALAFNPEIRGAILNVGGSGLCTVIQDSPGFGLLVPGLVSPTATKADVARFLSAAQAVYDSGDAINFSRFVTLEAPPNAGEWSPTNVLLQEAMDDTLVPNSSTSLLARALGLTHVGTALAPIDGLETAPAPLSGNLQDQATGGVFQFDRTDGSVATHNSLGSSSEARAQYAAFFAAIFEEEPGLIIDPYAED